MKSWAEYETLPDDLYMPEKFPEPRTYPNGRNMENAVVQKTDRVRFAGQPVQHVEPDCEHDWEPEKFPKTNTCPSGWDISSIYNDFDSRK